MNGFTHVTKDATLPKKISRYCTNLSNESTYPVHSGGPNKEIPVLHLYVKVIFYYISRFTLLKLDLVTIS